MLSHLLMAMMPGARTLSSLHSPGCAPFTLAKKYRAGTCWAKAGRRLQWLYPLQASCALRRSSGRSPEPFQGFHFHLRFLPFLSRSRTSSIQLSNVHIPSQIPHRTDRSDTPFALLTRVRTDIANPGLTSSTPTPWRLPWAGRSPTMSLARRRRPSWSVSSWPRAVFSSAMILGKPFFYASAIALSIPWHPFSPAPYRILEDSNDGFPTSNVTNMDRHSTSSKP